MLYPEAFVFDIEDNPLQKATKKQIKAVTDLDEKIGDCFGEFSDPDSVYGKLTWMNHHTWMNL